jgi:general stress protein 26
MAAKGSHHAPPSPPHAAARACDRGRHAYGMVMTDSVQARSHLLSLLHGFDTAMLATRTVGGGVRGRPMGFAEVQDDGKMLFSSSLDDPKVAELQADPHVAVLMQGKTQWISISGTARIVRDRSLIDRLWSDSWKLWFPEGKTDPMLCIIVVDPTEGEYWDNSGTHGVRFAIEAAKAYLHGRTPDARKMDENAKVRL